MTDYKLLVLSNPTTGEEQEFETWYGNHLVELQSMTPFLSGATRYRRVDADAGDPASHQHLVIADWRADDPAASWRRHMDNVGKAIAAGSFTPPPPAVDMKTMRHWMFEPIE